MSKYPEGHHMTCFVVEELRNLGATVEWDPPEVEETEGPFSVNGVPIAWMLDNRMPQNAARQDPAARRMITRGDVLVLHAQREDARRVGGIWLPLAATPGYTRAPSGVEKTRDATFVGFVREGRRAMFLEQVKHGVSLSVVENVFYGDASSAYHEGHVGLNVPSDVGAPYAYDVNMRVFEIMASGVPLVTNNLPGLRDLGILDGVNCLVYDDAFGAIEAIKWLISHPRVVPSIVENALKLIELRHTYRHRAMAILHYVSHFNDMRERRAVADTADIVA